ncbi:MAG: hypothetical protein R3190_03340 [Thermoanaerobaculia bacterium]|nr:hypothetical protein [Thermoanaerobaculia bacterium]
MKHHAIVGALVVLAAATAAASEPYRSFEREFPAAELERLSLEVRLGEITVEAADVSVVRIVVDVRCGSGLFERGCRRRAEDVDLRERSRDGYLDLDVTGLPAFSAIGVKVHTLVTMPVGLDTRLELGIGEIEVRGVEGELVVDLGIGQVDVRAGGSVEVDAGIGEVSVEVPARVVGQASVEVGIGQSTLVHPDGRLTKAGVLGSENEWRAGEGTEAVRVELGIGEARLVVR